MSYLYKSFEVCLEGKNESYNAMFFLSSAKIIEGKGISEAKDGGTFPPVSAVL